MVSWPKTLVSLLLCSAMPLTGPAPKAVAATSSTIDILPDETTGPSANAVEVGNLKPIARPDRPGSQPLPSGNPLWAVPLSVLTTARERPIFAPSRRPPPLAVATVASRVRVPARPAAEPEHPPLALVGAVVGESDAIAVLLDRTTQAIVRMRQGEIHAGWVLSAVSPREVTFRKAERTEVLVLRGAEDRPAGVPVPPATPGLVVPAAGGTGTPFVPFVPRSTPRNGEADGL